MRVLPLSARIRRQSIRLSSFPSGPLYQMHHRCPAIAGHPNAMVLDAAIQLTAAAVLLQEGIEGGE
jgi:hypothetical protein